ncbi:ATP-binding protein [Kutzneria kofuensis]|uniref:AAA ATPase-like protein n=1 Tax=Kutzneria kofuensis TaxID=103725 RepID=A0A7W9KE55_9PSEU|nr:ATP-binding protein [Kutzneria kofuensis]MBB5890940.1 hypothetical protein [Kutzneria kofuensis]
MVRGFIGRTDQLRTIRAALTAPVPASLVITGEHGAGRSSLLAAALSGIDLSDTLLLRVTPAASPQPLSALRAVLPADVRTAAEAVHAIADLAAGKRLIITVDDAHLVDHTSMFVLSELNHDSRTTLVVTEPHGASGSPAAVDFVRYRHDTTTVRLGALTTHEVAALVGEMLDGEIRVGTATAAALHAATRGNAGLLSRLVSQGLLDALQQHPEGWQLAEFPTPRECPADEELAARLLQALEDAWRAVALGRVDMLCRLATWVGLGQEVLCRWAIVLLLRGRPDDSWRLLQSAEGAVDCRRRFVEAIVLAFGHGHGADAVAALQAAIADKPDERSIAHLAWFQSLTGDRAAAAATLAALADRVDPEVRLFAHTARACNAVAIGHYVESVPELRRALICADLLAEEFPWLPGYLTGCLIDSLLLGGRIGEATTLAREFHAAARNSGWAVAVALGTLAGRHGGQSPAAPRVAAVSPRRDG